MKLFFKPGACSLASHIVLNELGVDFDLEKTDTTTKTTESGIDFLTININGYVPALQLDDGEVITENPAVLQYLADLAPERSLAPPNGSIERIRLQEALNFVSSELHRAFGPFFDGGKLDDEGRRKAISNIGRRVSHIERYLGDGRPYLLGEDFTVADAYTVVVLNWADLLGIELTGWPSTRAYVDRVKERPSVVAAMRREGLIQAERAA